MANSFGEYESKFKTTIITVNGSYSKSKFSSKQEEENFFRFLDTESQRLFDLKLPEYQGKTIAEIRNLLYEMYFPRWGQE